MVRTDYNYPYVTHIDTSNVVYASGCFDSDNDSKTETKKERIKRIAKELMYASWKVYNDKTETIKEIKQICKPRHRVIFRRF